MIYSFFDIRCVIIIDGNTIVKYLILFHNHKSFAAITLNNIMIVFMRIY